MTRSRRASTALGGVGGNLIYERAESADGDKYFTPGDRGLNERWHSEDGSAFRYRASVDGTPLVDLSRDTTEDVFVDHRAHTYRTLPGVPPSRADQDDVWTPEEIQQAIRDGRITVTGPDNSINGTPTVRLTIAAAKAGVQTEMWVNATTLPTGPLAMAARRIISLRRHLATPDPGKPDPTENPHSPRLHRSPLQTLKYQGYAGAGSRVRPV